METFGVPRRIICDRGSAFTSKKFVDHSRKCGFKTVYNATATPRANGQVERYNQTILNSLTASMEVEDNWDKVIAKIRFAINNTINTTTGKSPYELFFGYRPKGLSEAYLHHAISVEEPSQSLQEIRKEAENKTKMEQVKQKERYDKSRCRPRNYKVGEHVLIRKNVASNDGRSKKTLPKFQGPFVVTKVLSHDRYCIEDMQGATRSQKPYKGVCAIDKMKPFIIDQETDEGQGESSSDK